ncbi:MAG: cell division transport system permease protein [Chloroflexota bacterium]|jgi:cell division transport system permease protein|nr:cell division transport system permease protein [Chloroflexota bacterium]
MLTSVLFAPRVAIQNFWRNKGLSTFAVSVMFVVLLMTGVALVLGHSFNQAIGSLKAKASTISIFIRDSTPLQNTMAMENRLRSDPRVRSVTYVDKASALARYKEDPSIPPDMIENLEGQNPLPASLDVDVKNIQDLDGIANEVKDSPILDKAGATNYKKDVIDRVVLFSQFIGVAGGILLIGLGAVAVFIIMMSIRTAVFVRRKEIEVMKLVGATDWFVRGPFLLEGMLSGMIASVLAVVVVAGGYRPFVDSVRGSVPFLPLSYDVGFIWQLCLVMALVGVGLGAFGSWLGVRRFLQA